MLLDRIMSSFVNIYHPTFLEKDSRKSYNSARQQYLIIQSTSFQAEMVDGGKTKPATTEKDRIAHAT